MPEKSFFWTAFKTLLLLLLAACSPTFMGTFDEFKEDERERLPASARPVEASGPILPGKFAPQQALQLLYGSYDSAAKLVRWQPAHNELRQLGFQPATKLAHTRALFTGNFVQQQQEYSVLLVKTLPAVETCRACRPVLGGALFTKIEAGWQLTAHSIYLAQLGLMDGGSQTEQARLIRLGPARYGVRVHWQHVQARLVEEGDVLVAADTVALQTLLTLDTGAGNQERCDPAKGINHTADCWAYHTKLDVVPGVGRDYFDLRAVTTGSRPNATGQVVRVHQTQHYRYSNGAYRLQAESSPPTSGISRSPLSTFPHLEKPTMTTPASAPGTIVAEDEVMRKFSLLV